MDALYSLIFLAALWAFEVWEAMSGGNSHQRAVERSAKARLGQKLPKDTLATITKDLPTKKRHDTPQFLHIVALLGIPLVYLLQVNGVIVIAWSYSLLIYAAILLVFIWAFLEWDKPLEWSPIIRTSACIVISLVLALLSAKGVYTQYGNEHPQNVLSVSSRAPSVAYPVGEKIGGIKWKDKYGDLPVTIENSAEPSIQNLDLTVQVLDKGFIWDMGQLSGIPGIEFRPPDDFPEVGVRLYGTDGGSATVTLRDMWDLGGMKGLPFSDHYKVFCPRLIGKAQLRLILATETEKITGPTPMKVRIFGSYELMPSEGSKPVKVDMTTPVSR